MIKELIKKFNKIVIRCFYAIPGAHSPLEAQQSSVNISKTK